MIELNYKPLPYQADLHNDKSRFKLVVGGRRVGKSVADFQEFLRHCLTTEDALAWWISPTYAEAREIGYEQFLHYYEQLEPAVVDKHDGMMKVEFINGAQMYFKGADRKDSLRGRGLTFLVIDEAAFVNRDTWQKVLRPALSDKDGSAMLTTTPNGRNWIFDVRSSAAAAGWSVYIWPTSMNPTIDPSEIEEARSMLSSEDFKQEYEAEFVTKAGQVYSEFNEANLIKSFDLNPEEWRIYIGADFGYANPSAFVFIAVHLSGNKIVQFDELYGSRMSMEEINTGINARLGKWNLSHDNVEAIYTDPAGNAEEITSGISPVDYLRRTYEVYNKGTEIYPGLQLVRSMICNANGERKFKVLNQCKETVKSLFGYTYALKQNTEEIKEVPLKDGKHDHACDAIRYAFVNIFDHAKWLARSPKSFDYVGTKAVGKRYLKRCSKCRRSFPSETQRTKPPFLCEECSK